MPGSPIDKLIKLTPKTAFSYEVRHLSDVKLGEFYMEVDGFYVFEPESRTDYWPERILMALSLKLKELNFEWEQKIEKDLKNDAK